MEIELVKVGLIIEGNGLLGSEKDGLDQNHTNKLEGRGLYWSKSD